MKFKDLNLKEYDVLKDITGNYIIMVLGSFPYGLELVEIRRNGLSQFVRANGVEIIYETEHNKKWLDDWKIIRKSENK